MDAKTIEQGRAHDAAMSKGTWEAAEVDGYPLWASLHMGGNSEWIRTHDAAGIAWMRNHLSALLDAAEERDRLLAEVERLRAPVPYRPGLPTREQMRRHTERSAAAATSDAARMSIAGAGGWWQVLYPNATYALMKHLDHRHTRYHFEDHRQEQYRPCLPDGTPCPWEDG